MSGPGSRGVRHGWHHRFLRELTVCRHLLAAFVVMTAPVAHASEFPDPALRAALESALADPGSFADAAEAQVWLIDMGGRLSPWIKDPHERTELLRAVHREAKRADVPPEMVLAVIEIESAFQTIAISSAGALGLMQVMPFWTREIGRPEDNLLDRDTNLRYGTTILAHYLARENGHWERALNRYNGKLRDNPYAGKVLDALRLRWFRQ